MPVRDGVVRIRGQGLLEQPGRLGELGRRFGAAALRRVLIETLFEVGLRLGDEVIGGRFLAGLRGRDGQKDES